MLIRSKTTVIATLQLISISTIPSQFHTEKVVGLFDLSVWLRTVLLNRVNGSPQGE